MPKAVVALSGGVDSSVAAAVLLGDGFDVLGVTLKFGEDGFSGFTNSDIRHTESFVTESEAVARHLGIEHLTIEAHSKFHRHVIEPSVEAYQRGQTPNPCLLCNNKMKFGLLAEFAAERNAFLATGHYARITRSDRNIPVLCRAADESKDQSYILFHLLEHNRLERVLFPLGAMQKSEVRSMAKHHNLPSATREESQDICFPLKSLIPAVPGRIINENGEILGYHEGINRFTIGQRQGLGISAANRMYVTAIYPNTNEIVVGPDESLYHRSAVVHPYFWSQAFEQRRYHVMAKIRYNHTPASAVIEPKNVSLHIEFDEPQRAITPGQACGCYVEDHLISGGILQSVDDSP